MDRSHFRRETERCPVARPAARVEGLERRLLFAAVVRSVAGDADAVTNVARWQFQDDLHDGPWGTNGEYNTGAPQASLAGSRQITGWEGASPYHPPPDMPGTFYRDVVQWGMLLSTPGTGFKASATHPVGRFGEINPTYPDTFKQRTGGKLFAAAGSTLTDVVFRVPGTDLPAFTSGFGVVFTDVDSATATTIELFDPAGASLGRYAAPAMDRGLSFVGVSFNAGERVARVRITAGNTPLGPNDGGAAADVVAIDDFFYGEPQPIQPNVYRFDRGTPTNRSVTDWSRPLAWARDAVPPTDGTAILEFPSVWAGGLSRPQGTSWYDLPSGAGFDSLVFTAAHEVISFNRKLVRLRNGIRAVSGRDVPTELSGLDIELTGDQTVEAGHHVTTLELRGVGFDLNGHDLTFGGIGAVRVSGGVLDGSDGGRVIINQTGNPRDVHAAVHLAGRDATTGLAIPGGIHLNAGTFYLGHGTSPATPVRVNAGTLRIEAREVVIGALTVAGGTADLTNPFDRFLVRGNATFGAAATFATSILGSNPATPGGPPRTPSSNHLDVDGAVSLGGAALKVRVVHSFEPQQPTPIPGDNFLLVANDGSDPVGGTFKDLPEGAMFSQNGRLYRITYRGGDGNDVMLSVLAAGTLDHASRGEPVRITFAPNVLARSVRKQDLSVMNVTTDTPVPPSAFSFSYSAATRTATWIFGGRFADGNYRATLDTDGLLSRAATGDFTFDSFILTGDINRDRSVSGSDFAILAGNFGKAGQTYASGDLNGDGSVNGSDFALLAGNFGKRLDVEPAPVPPAAAAAPAAETTPVVRRAQPAARAHAPGPRGKTILPPRRQLSGRQEGLRGRRRVGGITLQLPTEAPAGTGRTPTAIR